MGNAFPPRRQAVPITKPAFFGRGRHFRRRGDALTRISMQRLVEQVWLQQKFTAIMVTHDVAEAVALADRVLMIEDGKIAFDLRIDLPRPRERGATEFGALEAWTVPLILPILRHHL